MSQPLSLAIPHKLGREEARRRIEGGMGQFTQQLGGAMNNFQQGWVEDRLNFSGEVMGQTITGAMEVLEDAVRMEVTLPGFLGLMAGKIKSKLHKEGQALLERK